MSTSSDHQIQVSEEWREKYERLRDALVGYAADVASASIHTKAQQEENEALYIETRRELDAHVLSAPGGVQTERVPDALDDPSTLDVVSRFLRHPMDEYENEYRFKLTTLEYRLLSGVLAESVRRWADGGSPVQDGAQP